MNQNSLYIAFLGCMMGWNSLYKENFHHLIFLSYFVYNVNKMQDLYLKITFIIVWIVFKYKNNDEDYEIVLEKYIKKRRTQSLVDFYLVKKKTLEVTDQQRDYW